MKTAALLVAAGRGTRLGADIPKQYIPLNGACSLRRSTDLFLGIPEIASVLTVIHADDGARYEAALNGLTSSRLLPPVHGGTARTASVRAGLHALAIDPPDAVLIHDAARPFMPVDVIHDVIAALDESDGVCTALPVVDALWKADDEFAEEPVSREGLWRTQTPQGFRFTSILAAYRAYEGEGTDDVAVARKAGMAVKLVRGDEAGYKITTAQDLERALRDARSP